MGDRNYLIAVQFDIDVRQESPLRDCPRTASLIRRIGELLSADTLAFADSVVVEDDEDKPTVVNPESR